MARPAVWTVTNTPSMHWPPMFDRVAGELRARPGGEGMSEIVRRCASLSNGERVALAKWIHKALAAPSRPLPELERVALVKTLVALLPESARTLRAWIRSTTPEAAEVRFTIFCYLEHLPRMENGRDFSRDVPSLVGEFLLKVQSDTARAAWMAGDLLGEHWSLPSALPVLLTVATEGRFAAGRKSAIHGLCHAMERASESDRQRIRETLRAIGRKDRSLKVRKAASAVLEGRFVCSLRACASLGSAKTRR